MSQTKVLSALPGGAKPLPPKGRAASKLSSRHNRRKKRRDREGNESGVKRKADRVPIPSFTPLADEGPEGVVVRSASGACAEGTSEACSSDPPVSPPDECVDVTKSTDVAKEHSGIHTESTTQKNKRLHPLDVPACADDDGALCEQEQPCARKQKLLQGAADESVHRKDQGPSAAVAKTDESSPAPDRGASSEDNALAKMAQKIQQQSPPQAATNNSSPAMQKSGEGCAVEEANKKSPPNIDTTASCKFPPGEANNEKAKSLTPNGNEGIPSQSVQKSDQIERNKSGGNGAVDAKAAKLEPPEVIELLDDDAEVAEVAEPKGKKGPSTKKSNPEKKADAKKRKPPKSGKRKVSSDSDDERVSGPTRAKKPRQRKATQQKDTVKVEQGKTTKQTKASRNKLCFACSSCKCNSRAGTASTPQKFSNALSGSDARQEQQLVNRLQRVERDIAWKEGQRNDVARQLMKHRTQMQKKWESQNASTKASRPRFLADADASDELGCSHSTICFEEVDRVKSKIFGRQNTKQATLTQMIGEVVLPESIKVETNGVDDSPSKAKSPEAQGEGDSPASHDDFLSFWVESAPEEEPTTDCVGTMADLNRALVTSKAIKSTGAWAKATANSLRVQEEEGFDALVDLFDESMDQSGECAGCSQASAEDDDCTIDTSPARALSPCAKGVASDIQSSVTKDPQKREAIERRCPQWKENVEFAQAQAYPDDVDNALQNVRQAKADLEQMKERILQAFHDRHQTLELYEKSLQGSKERLAKKEEL